MFSFYELLNSKFYGRNLVMCIDCVEYDGVGVHVEIDYTYEGGETGEFILNIINLSHLDTVIEKKRFDFEVDYYGEQIGYVKEYVTVEEALLIDEIIDIILEQIRNKGDI